MDGLRGKQDQLEEVRGQSVITKNKTIHPVKYCSVE